MKDIREQLEEYEDHDDDLIPRDPVTGKKQHSPLNKAKLSSFEMDVIFAGEDWH